MTSYNPLPYIASAANRVPCFAVSGACPSLPACLRWFWGVGMRLLCCCCCRCNWEGAYEACECKKRGLRQRSLRNIRVFWPRYRESRLGVSFRWTWTWVPVHLQPGWRESCASKPLRSRYLDDNDEQSDPRRPGLRGCSQVQIWPLGQGGVAGANLRLQHSCVGLRSQ